MDDGGPRRGCLARADAGPSDKCDARRSARRWCWSPRRPLARADGDRALSGELGWATFSAPGKATNSQTPPAVSPDWGAAVDVIYEHGDLDRLLAARRARRLPTFSGGLSDPKKQSQQSYAGIGDVGVVFRFDVLRLVPYAFGGIGGIAATGGPISTTGLTIAVGGGAEFLVDRHHSVGLEARLSSSFGTDLTVVTAGLRVSSHWGF